MAVNANERSMSGRESSTSDGNGTFRELPDGAACGERAKSAPSPQSGVLSSSTVEKETLSKEQHKPIKDVPAKDKKMPTVIVFDLETTGLSKERDRIVGTVHEFVRHVLVLERN